MAKNPVTKKVAKVPVVLQLEALECGAACLDMVLAYYHKWIPIEQVRKDCGVSRDGSSAKNILLAARNYGLTARGYRYEVESLKESGSFPCIIHWNFNHFVVLDGFRRDCAVLNDPARGRVEVSMKEFDESFTGICIQLEPGEDFAPSGKKESVWDFLGRCLRGTKAALIFFLGVSAVSTVLSIATPAFSRFFIDQLLDGKNTQLQSGFLFVIAQFAVIEILITGIQEIYSLKIQGKFAVVANSQFMWHALCLPIEFFSQRMTGDVVMRKQKNEVIASTVLQTGAPLVFDFVMTVIYAVIMVRYSVVLALIGIGGILLNLVLVQVISAKRQNVSQVMLRDENKLGALTIDGIDMIETIKSSGAEDGFFSKWAGYQASVNSHNEKLIKLESSYTVIAGIISEMVNAFILGLGVLFVLQGHFSIGMILAFQTLLTTIQLPVSEMVTSQDLIRDTRVSMKQIDDVMNYPADVQYQPGKSEEGKSYGKLGGKVEMRNVTFGYSRLAPPLIENFSMTLMPGKRVAFVGGSGCGKSTLAKLISGLYKPWSGEILFDGKPMDEIDRNIFTGSLAVVDQDITLFEDTIANNIRMWDTSIEDFEVILAARDASLHEDIMQREGGYQYKIAEGGRDFSGGQRQRMEIARVLAQDPTIIIMDEATSALDARTEYDVVNAVRDRGISCIVIAHRLSTIRDCDEIIVMDQGKVAERGTHEELMEKHGEYEKLIMSE